MLYLFRLGIPLVMDLPVGKNLQSHVGTGQCLYLVCFSFAVYSLYLKNTCAQVKLCSHLRNQSPSTPSVCSPTPSIFLPTSGLQQSLIVIFSNLATGGKGL